MEDQPELLNDAMAKLKPLPPLSKEVTIRIIESSISNDVDEINELNRL